MQAMIFAAGLGTRLKPLTDQKPKALVEVGGEPLLKRVILRLRDAGFTRVVVNVYHFADQIIDYLRANNNFQMDILVSDERGELLDTGGGIRKALPLFDADEPVLLHNVDILSNADLCSLYRHASRRDAVLLVSERVTQRYLLFSKDEEHRLQGWTNISTGEVRSPFEELAPAQCARFAFSGIHVISPSLFPVLAAMPARFGIIDFYLRHCRQYSLAGYVQPALRLLDVGKPETLREANKAYMQNL